MARKYRCPYCQITFERPKLIEHIDKQHTEMIPEGYDSARIVFDIINKTTGGTCRVCKSPTPWNPKIQRYDVLCDNPKCKDKMREEYKKNMIRVKGTYNILNDPEQQKLMLSHRKISGKYEHSDGGILSYTGEYERKCLEFMDVVLEIPSKEIFSPGPTMEYIYNGAKHIYIPDFYLPFYNLIIEIKDGGDNKNGQESASRIASKEKTIEKERLITDKGTYNYIRLTNNEFPQLIEMFMIMKQKLIEGDDSVTIKINENTIDDFVHKLKLKLSLEPFKRAQRLNDIMTAFNYDNNAGKEDKSQLIKYKTLTPDEFKKLGLGVCWDYTAFEADYFEKNIPEIKWETYFIAMQERSGAVSTHTFLIFEYHGAWYWFESAWKQYEGIRGFKNKKDCLEYIIQVNYDTLSSGSVLYIREYYARDQRIFGLNGDEFMNVLMDGINKSNYVPNKHSKIKPIYKYTPLKHEIENTVDHESDEGFIFI